MSRLVAIFAAATAFVLACATSFATPIAPIPTASADYVTQAYYYHGHHYPYYTMGITITVEAGIMATGITGRGHCTEPELS